MLNLDYIIKTIAIILADFSILAGDFVTAHKNEVAADANRTLEDILFSRHTTKEERAKNRIIVKVAAKYLELEALGEKVETAYGKNWGTAEGNRLSNVSLKVAEAKDKFLTWGYSNEDKTGVDLEETIDAARAEAYFAKN